MRAKYTPRERYERARARQRDRDRRRRRRGRDARDARDRRAEAIRKAHMRRQTRAAYSEAHRPLPGSPRDVRLRVLAMSLRELARRAGMSHETARRVERGYEGADVRPVSGPSLRKYAKTIERLTRRRTRFEDVRPPRRDGR